MTERINQFEDSLEEWKPADKALIIQMQAAYRHEMNDANFESFKLQFWELYSDSKLNLIVAINQSTGMNRERHEAELIDLYFRVASLLAAGGFVGDSIKFLEDRLADFQDEAAKKKMLFTFRREILSKRLINAIDEYRTKLIPQYIRDLDAKDVRISSQENPSFSRSMLP